MNTSRTTRALAIASLSVVALAACSSAPESNGGQNAHPQSGAASNTAAATAAVTAATPAPTVTQPPTATQGQRPAPNTPAGQPAPAGFAVQSVTFVSAATGFALGIAPCGAARCSTLVGTVDAGRTWRLIGHVGPALNGADLGVTKIRFATTQDGWVFGPQLWSTHDGGQSWRQASQPQPVDDVEAAAGVAYAVEGDRLLRAPVGSDSWQDVRQVGGGEVGGGEIALHGHAIWVVEANPAGAGKLAFSADGVSWQQLPDPCARLGSPWALSSVAPVTTADVFLLCGGGAGAGSESKKVLFSADAGRTASVTPGDPPRAGVAAGIAAASDSVVAVVAMSGASEVYRSGDAGKSWQTVLSQGDGGVGYRDVGFTTAEQGVAVYGQPSQSGGPPSALLMTRDAGATWSVVRF